MRRALLARGLALPLLAGVFVAGCHARQPPAYERDPELIAVGEVVDASGAPIAGASVASYRLRIVARDTEIIREYTEDDDDATPGIETSEAGTFRVLDGHFLLAIEWDEDVWVCEDVCTLYETTCATVDEQVCTPVCQDVTYDDCWDECWDECVQTCEDVTTCDDSGCWTDTYCSDDCTTYCEPVCQTVTETQCYDDCTWVSHEECSDACVQTVEECGWQTVHHVDPVALDEVQSVSAEITWRGTDGVLQTTKGAPRQSGEQDTCAGVALEGATCTPYELWVQRDTFTRTPSP